MSNSSSASRYHQRALSRDEETHSIHTMDSLIPNPEPHTTPKHLAVLRTHFYKATSIICTTAFLGVLFILSIITHYYRLVRPPKDELPAKVQFRPAFPEERGKLKIVDDLRFYINLMGFELQEYNIITDDGFYIDLKRIVNPYEPEIVSKPPILLVHGLLQSSASFVTSGQKSLAFHLLRNGYDVWLGDNRCGFNPRHQFLSTNDAMMWNWDIIDMATNDIPCFINNILKINTNYDKVSLCCHSQGTTQGFVALSKFFNPTLNQHIECFVALAPAVFGGPMLDEKLFIRFINCLNSTMYNVFFGILSFMPIMMHCRKLIYKYKIFGFLSYSMFNFLFDWDDRLWDPSLRSLHFLFSPVYISTQLMRWWLSKDGFIDSKSILDDTDSWFDDETTPPIKLFIASRDRLVNGDKLIDHLENYEPNYSKFEVNRLPNYSHLDVLWADDVVEQIGVPMVDFLNRVRQEN